MYTSNETTHFGVTIMIICLGVLTLYIVHNKADNESGCQ